MAWELIKKPEITKASKQLAARFRDMTALQRDRQLQQRRLTLYDKMIDQRTFRPITWADCYCKEDAITYRVNGHHTSHLLADKSVIPDIFITIEHYQADTLEDVSELWNTFDSTLGSRNSREIYAASASCVPELAGVSKATISVAVTGINYALHPMNMWKGMTPPERARVVFDQAPFILWLHETVRLTAEKSEHLLRSPVIAAMYMSHKASQRAATEFWLAVRDETSPIATAPDRVLARWLRKKRLGAGTQRSSSSRITASHKEFYAQCGNAWTAWRRKETVDLRYNPSAKLPVFA